MAGIPPEHTKWKPGQSGNPSGKPKGLLTADKVSAMIGTLSALPLDELKSKKSDPKTPALEAIMASILIEALEKGDFSRLDGMLARAIGKVKDTTDLHVTNHDAEFDKEPKENIIDLLREKRGPKLEGTNG